MGTRSTYRVIEKWTDNETGKKGVNKIVLMYLQFDGYPTGHPMDTAQWLASGKVVNGFGTIKENEVLFNGASCLAAQLVAKYKHSVGGCYLHPINHRGNCWENYTYDIIINEDKTIEYVCYKVKGGYGKKRPSFKAIFSGTPQEFIAQYDKVEVE
jgi:hypothetical protein